MHCIKCGTELKDGSSFCTSCGADQTIEPEQLSLSNAQANSDSYQHSQQPPSPEPPTQADPVPQQESPVQTIPATQRLSSKQSRQHKQHRQPKPSKQKTSDGLGRSEILSIVAIALSAFALLFAVVMPAAGIHLFQNTDDKKARTATDNSCNLSGIYTSGFITNSTQYVCFTVPVSQATESREASITSKGTIIIRQEDKYLYGSSPEKSADVSNARVSKVGDGYVTLVCEVAASSDATNNDACGVQLVDNWEITLR